MSEHELIERFETGRVAPEAFHHADHVRLAFAYVKACSVLNGLGRFSESLKRFAVAQGKADRYHETITFAYFFLIRERMARRGCVTWEEFAASNADLFKRNNEILKRYYEAQTLKSDLARNVFVFPDRF
jgi:hypothetical protein